MCSLILLPAAAFAFSSISAGSSSLRPPIDTENNNDSSSQGANLIRPGMPNIATSGVAAAPWRMCLDIGREELARMPFDWARSGCRMPLVIPTDFSSDSSVSCHFDTVSFTGPEGAVVRPITGKSWKLSKNERTLTLSYNLPEAMKRRDVCFDDDTELVLTGRVYTQKEFDRLNNNYYQAREELWKAGAEIGDIYDRKDASKKWDEESGQWVQRYKDESPLIIAQKQLFYWGANLNQNRKKRERPDLKDLSDRGSLPGVEGGIYFAKSGVVRVGHNGPVCGTWSAMPITGAPASYRGS